MSTCYLVKKPYQENKGRYIQLSSPPSFSQPIHASVHLSTHSYTNSYTHPNTHTYFYLSIYLSIRPIINHLLSIHFIQLSIHPFLYPAIYRTIN